MNRSSARAVISAYLFNIYAMERQIATTDTTKMRDFARLVSLRRTSMHPHEKQPSTRETRAAATVACHVQRKFFCGCLGCWQEVRLWSFSIINRKSWLLLHDRGTYLLGWFSNYVGRRAGPPLNLIKLAHERGGSDSNNCVGMI